MFKNVPQKYLYYKTLKEHTDNKSPIKSFLERLADLCGDRTGLKLFSVLDLALLWGIIEIFDLSYWKYSIYTGKTIISDRGCLVEENIQYIQSNFIILKQN